MDMQRNFLRSAPLTSAFFLAASVSCLAQDNAAQPTAASSKIYTTTGSLDGVTFTVKQLKRNPNGTLTLSLTIQGTQGKPVRREAIGFNGDKPWRQDFKLLDMANKKRYSMLEDNSGYCLCTHLSDEELADIGAGKSKNINIKFPLPPSDVTSITVELPHAEPIDDVPITN
jgi:hypothetical protein